MTNDKKKSSAENNMTKLWKKHFEMLLALLAMVSQFSQCFKSISIKKVKNYFLHLLIWPEYEAIY
jgi:hypothetical protein